MGRWQVVGEAREAREDAAETGAPNVLPLEARRDRTAGRIRSGGARPSGARERVAVGPGRAFGDVDDHDDVDGVPVLAPVVRTTPEGDALPRGDSILEIYEAEHLGLFRFVRAATRDEAAAEDVLQEAFLRLVREVSSGRIPTNVHAWLFRVAANLVVTQVRRLRTAERHLPALVSAVTASSPEQHVLAAERDDAVRAALAALPLDARMALVLAAQGFTGREIARAIGRTEGAARTLLARARMRLRTAVADDQPGLAGAELTAGGPA